MRRILRAVAVVLVVACVSASQAGASVTAVVGSPFSTGGSRPGSVAFDPSGAVLAVEDESIPGSTRGISTFSVDATTGALTPSPGSPAAIGDGQIPGNLTFDPEGTELVTAAPQVLAGGSVALFAVDSTTGELSNGLRTGSAVVNDAVSFRSDGLIALGGYGGPGSPSPVELVQFNHDSNTLSGFPALNTAGGLQSSVSSLAFSPTRPILAVADEAHHSVAIYEVDATGGGLSLIPGSPTSTGTESPVSVAFNPAGTVLAVATFSGAVYTYAVDPSTGALTASPGSPVTAGSSASSLAFGHDLLAVATNTAGTVTLFAVDQTTGSLTKVADAPASSDLSKIALSPDDRLLAATNPNGGTVSVFATGYPYPGPIVVGSPTFDVNAGEKLVVPATAGLLGSGAGSAPPPGQKLEVVAAQAATTHGSVTINADGSFAYTPNGGFEGVDHFAFTLSDGGSARATATATVTVHGPAISAPQSVTFGPQTLATTGPVVWATVTNAGNAPLHISGPATVAGANAADFAIASGDDGCNGAAVAAGASCQIGVRFTPSTTAGESATLSLGANDSVSSPGPIALTGTGVAPVPALMAPGPTGFARPAPTTATPARIGPIHCVLHSSHRRVHVRCTLKRSTAATRVHLVVRQKRMLVASGPAHLSDLRITASLPLHRALRRNGHATVTISIPGLTAPAVVHATTR
jgi:6-phosphogluconolactonase (cycloisomerase 2 family)